MEASYTLLPTLWFIILNELICLSAAFNWFREAWNTRFCNTNNNHFTVSCRWGRAVIHQHQVMGELKELMAQLISTWSCSRRPRRWELGNGGWFWMLLWHAWWHPYITRMCTTGLLLVKLENPYVLISVSLKGGICWADLPDSVTSCNWISTCDFVWLRDGKEILAMWLWGDVGLFSLRFLFFLIFFFLFLMVNL